MLSRVCLNVFSEEFPQSHGMENLQLRKSHCDLIPF